MVAGIAAGCAFIALLIVALTSLAAENAKNAFSDINGESTAEWPAVLRADDAESAAGQAAAAAAQ